MLTDSGRGVFAAKSILARTVVEICPVLVFPISDLSSVSRTAFEHYTFNWPYREPQADITKRTQALALGLGSMFNHSRNQNVGFQRNVEDQTITFTALRDIEPQEELCISYGPRLWFEDAEKLPEDSEPEPDALMEIELR